MTSPTAIPHIALPKDVPPYARVWIYQSSRELTPEEVVKLRTASDVFVKQWKAHGSQLKTAFGLYFNRFLCLFVDESASEASGCSIDSSVKFVKDAERLLDVSFTNRMLIAWLDGNNVRVFNLSDLPALYKDGKINGNTLIFDNLVTTKADMESRWIVPLGESWLTRLPGYINTAQ